jgi:hypothetical protein
MKLTELKLREIIKEELDNNNFNLTQKELNNLHLLLNTALNHLKSSIKLYKNFKLNNKIIKIYKDLNKIINQYKKDL